ncbi:hypothetical protein MNBD_GAMMA11-3001 [hydrothermal vent metagenome]|uniref:Uncharacterized protein n=1 Tax=hydrothermal vent metagenome TaxID=652676 RepID=A0A3B0XA91_9ZZZZ
MKNSEIAHYILSTTYKADADTFHIVEEILNQPRSTDDFFPRSVYKDADDSHFVEIVGIDSLSLLDEYLEDNDTLLNESKLRDQLTYDIRREVIRHQDTVKSINNWIPSTENIQMRYIEVPLYLLDEYHQWRDGTIFKNVSGRDEITGFTAYHSVISNVPGVTFFVEFDCAPEVINEGFTNAEYRRIVKDANSYIVGGNQNLYTRFYGKVYSSYDSVNLNNKQKVA